MTQAGYPGPLEELLGELEQELRQQGCPLVDRLAPGATDEAFAALARHGLAIPAQARTWWSWHDGAPGTYVEPPGYQLATWTLLSVDEALKHYDFSRDVARSLVEPGVAMDDWWPWSWLPLTRRDNGDTIVLDCAASADAPTVLLFRQQVPELIVARLPSLAALVQTWLTALQRGAWQYQPGQGWHREPRRLDGSADARAFI